MEINIGDIEISDWKSGAIYTFRRATTKSAGYMGRLVVEVDFRSQYRTYLTWTLLEHPLFAHFNKQTFPSEAAKQSIDEYLARIQKLVAFV
jgi:hypothetical protein